MIKRKLKYPKPVQKEYRGVRYELMAQQGVPGTVMTLLNAHWSPVYLDVYQMEKCQHIGIPYIGSWKEDLSFLDNFVGMNVDGISIGDFDQKDLTPVGQFPHIRLFTSQALCNKAPDFSCFANLDVLAFTHRRAMEPSYNSIYPRQLSISKYPYLSFQHISTFQKLQKLNIDRGKLETLDGVERFQHLEMLTLHGLRNLRSLKGLERCPNLKVLVIEGCHKVEDLAAYEYLRPRVGKPRPKLSFLQQ